MPPSPEANRPGRKYTANETSADIRSIRATWRRRARCDVRPRDVYVRLRTELDSPHAPGGERARRMGVAARLGGRGSGDRRASLVECDRLWFPINRIDMHYRHRVPRPPLDAFIESIWVYQNDPRPHALERIMPTGAAQLIVNLKEDQTRLYDPDFPSAGMSRPRVPCYPGCNPVSRSLIRQNRSTWQAWPSNREERCPSCVCPRTKRAMLTSRWITLGSPSVPPLSANAS